MLRQLAVGGMVLALSMGGAFAQLAQSAEKTQKEAAAPAGKSLAEQYGVSAVAIGLAEQAASVRWLKTFLPDVAGQAREQLKSQLPGVSEEAQNLFEQNYLAEMNGALEKLVLQIGIYYQKQWSAEEMDAIAAMLASPTGKTYLNGLSALEGPVGQALEGWIRTVPEQAAIKTANGLEAQGLLPKQDSLAE